jgi:hypothetical protein
MEGTKAYSQGVLLHSFIKLLLFSFFLIPLFFNSLLLLHFFHFYSLFLSSPRLFTSSRKRKETNQRITARSVTIPSCRERVDQLHRTIIALTYSTTRARSAGTHLRDPLTYLKSIFD